MKGLVISDHTVGGYRFLQGIAPYSSGVVALPGYEIVHVVFSTWIPLQTGLPRIIRYLDKINRPSQALCGMELRIPRAFSFTGFADFNASYRGLLQEHDLLLGSVNPLARTNVAPSIQQPETPVLYGFSYTMPVESAHQNLSFIVAGAGDLHDQSQLDPSSIIRPRENSRSAIRQKAAAVMEVMRSRLHGLGADWSAVTTINVYTTCPLQEMLVDIILGQTSSAARHGIRWYYSDPPIEGLIFEMDLHGVSREVRLV